MKTISSFGGPFIGLNRRDVARWSGVFGKRTVGLQSPFDSDYQAACSLTGRANLAFDVSGYFHNLTTGAFIIAPPVETALVMENDRTIIIAQVEAATEEWSFSDISNTALKQANFEGHHKLIIDDEAADYILFDSSIDGNSIQDYIGFTFQRGRYFGSSSMYNQDDIAELNLFRFSRLDEHQS